MAEALNGGAVAEAGYRVFHDVPGDGPWNVDHVVAGPGGVFVVETKARSRRRALREQEEHKVIYDGKTLIFPWCEDRKAVKQAERNADWVKKYLAEFLPQNAPVQPVVLLPGWFVETKGNYPVKVMTPTYLAENYLPTIKQRLTPEQLRPVLRRLDDRCRDLEF